MGFMCSSTSQSPLLVFSIDRIQRMWERYVFTAVCLLTGWGGGCTPSPSHNTSSGPMSLPGGKGYPGQVSTRVSSTLARSRWGTPPIQVRMRGGGGYPGQVRIGTPSQDRDEVTPSLDMSEWGTSTRTGMGYPLGQVRMGYPLPQ